MGLCRLDIMERYSRVSRTVRQQGTVTADWATLLRYCDCWLSHLTEALWLPAEPPYWGTVTADWATLLRYCDCWLSHLTEVLWLLNEPTYWGTVTADWAILLRYCDCRLSHLTKVLWLLTEPPYWGTVTADWATLLRYCQVPVHTSSLVCVSPNLPGCYVCCDVGAEAEEEHVTEHNTTTWQNCDGDTNPWLAIRRQAMYV